MSHVFCILFEVILSFSSLLSTAKSVTKNTLRRGVIMTLTCYFAASDISSFNTGLVSLIARAGGGAKILGQ